MPAPRAQELPLRPGSSLLDRATRLYEQGPAITGPCFSKSATSYFRCGCGRLVLSPVPIPVVMVLVLIDIMDVDTDTPVSAAANPRAHVSSVTAGPDHGDRRRLRNEDKVALESAATECDPEDCGTVSIRTLVPSMTPSTAACWFAFGQGAVVLQFLLEAV